MRTLVRAAALALLAAAAPAAAHEFWIEPLAARVAPGTALAARAMVGEGLAGEELANHAAMQEVADVGPGAARTPLAGPDGRTPAYLTPPLTEGLNILRVQSRAFQVTYAGWDKFTAFLDEAQRPELAAAHLARGLPREGIREVYVRYAKALVAVGAGAGSDAFLGMPFELVALDNPSAAPGPMRVELRLGGEPLAGAPAEAFHRAPDGSVTRTRLRTDAAGTVSTPAAGAGFTLVSAIHIVPATPRIAALTGASWQSLWASLSYASD
jgi:uncharacterized GH25 family protein